MRHATRSVLLLLLLALPARAHYNILLPDKPSCKKGEEVTFTYLWGHPFEHQIFDAPKPVLVQITTPPEQGVCLLYTKNLEETTVPSGDKKATAYKFKFKPERRGDYIAEVNTPPIWLEEEKEYVKDKVTVVLHVQAQSGWDQMEVLDSDEVFQWLPLTRPYGLLPGMVFQAQAVQGKKPLARHLVEIERYNPTPPKELPDDEHITRTAKTGPNGVVTTTLPEAGWWGLTTSRDAGTKERDGKKYPLKERITYWVHVDAKAGK